MRRMITDKLTKNIKEIVAAYQAGEIGAKVEVANITAIDSAILTDLNAGDIVVKKTGDQRHTYVVTYKEENKGICMTYIDASVAETVSYDYVTNTWVYNSTDVTSLGGASYTAGTGINISDDNKISINTNKVVTTDTTQTITGQKTFTGNLELNFSTFKGNMPIKMVVPNNQWTGINIYDSGNINQVCNLQYSDPSKGFYIGRSSIDKVNPTYAQELGFKSELGSGSSKTGYKVLIPNKTNITGTSSDNVYYIPTEITNGTNTVQANSEGIVDISSLVSGGGSSETVIEVSATINPSAATTVTLTSEQVASYNAAVLAHENITFVLLITGAPGAEAKRVYLRPGMYVYTGVPSVNSDTAFYGFYNNYVVKLNNISSSTGTITTSTLTFTS